MAATLQLQPIALAVALLLLLGTPVSAQQRPDCLDRCGNITVPYPFGIGAGCYRDDNFELVCDDSSSPPRLTFLGGTSNQLASLSLATGEARAYLNATRNCSASHKGTIIMESIPPPRIGPGPPTSAPRTPAPMSISMDLGGRSNDSSNPTAFRFSAAKNRLVALGCPSVVGFFVDDLGYYVSGCLSVCRPSGSELLKTGPCDGVGCCQSVIPPGITYYKPDVKQVVEGDNSTFGSNFMECRYTFLVDAEWFDFHNVSIDRTDDFTVHVVLDWAIRNVGNCSAASRNATDYACLSAQSECINSTNGAGYRCNCTKGYEGNPYLHSGCTDINECQRNDTYPCYGHCTNTQGSYTCRCHPGSSGDATAKDGCRPNDKFTLALKVITGVSVGVFLPVFMCFWLYLGLQKRKLIRSKQRFFEQNGGILLQQQMRSYSVAGGGTSGFKIFSTEELKKATNNFAADQILGRGGHGIVYKGILEDNMVVAIKKSKMMEEAETKEFAREMLILSQINHRNIVKLLGCCLEVEVPMLVYEYVSNGTLYHYIHSNTESTFDTRLRIAAESAEALAYMHSSASPPILHGDVKTANILLDGKLTSKVSDFGTSKLAPTDEAQVATLVQGTCGYLDPEYMMTCQLTDKSDVYSFAVVILELLTRKKAFYFDGPEENRSLVSCFMTAVKAGRQEELLDGKVRKEMKDEAVEEITHLVVRCLSMSGEERPAMKEVAESLAVLRRYQQHPRAKVDENLDEEEQSLLGKEQQGVSYEFRKQGVLDLEGGSTYFSM